jgi:hypothetical protein
MNDVLAAPRRRLTRDDILPVADYLPVRAERRRQIAELKRRRRLEIGPFATFHFENFATMRHQVQEMLAIEKGGEAQLADELDAYNPMVPQGRELVATVMLEIDDPLRRAAMLGRLGGIEERVFIDVGGIDVGGQRVRGIPDPARENTSPEGKASAVQFIEFLLSSEDAARFKTPGTSIVVGFDHPSYAHMTVMPEAVRAALAEDLA